MADRDNYECKDKESTRDKRVIPLLGASAVGKSTIIKACKNRAFDWGIHSIEEAGTTGTRAPRNGDPSNYNMGISHEQAIEMIEAGAPANWSLMPTGDIYMTMPSDFPAEYNFMACLPDSLPMLRRAGFDKVHPVYIVAPVDAWEDQLAGRIYNPDQTFRPDALGRVEEALASLEYAMGERSLLKITNKPGEHNLVQTADYILDVAKEKSSVYAMRESILNEFEKHSREMYSRAVDLAWEITQSSQIDEVV